MRAYLYGVLTGLVIAIAGYYVFRTGREPETRVVYRDLDAPRALTGLHVPRPLPVRRFIYRERVDTVRVPTVLPRDFGRIRGTLPDRYISRSRRGVVLRYFSPDDRRFVEEEYTFPERGWGLSGHVGGGYDFLSGFYGEGEVRLSRGGWSGFYGYVVSEDFHGSVFGIRRKVFSF